ncbi:MAG TPA: MBL fold metallo-hydrolase [Candidatus Kryptonia bacterium]
MTKVTEIAPDVYRISTFLTDGDIQMNQFLVKDDEPLLWHTGQKYLFTYVRDAVARLIDPSLIRRIGFSHFEPDECGSINEWLQVAPAAQHFCSIVGARINMRDYTSKPAEGLNHLETFTTGKYKFRFISTPHLPHGWDAGHLFEEVNGTLFCSDLLHQNGDAEPLTASDIISAAKKNFVDFQAGSFRDYMPYTTNTERQLGDLADLKPKTLAIMHGSSFNGDCAEALRDLAATMKEVLTRQGT